MTKEEILHLGTLSRIRLSDEEADQMHSEIEAILDYVGAINKIAGDEKADQQLGAVHNVFREDVVTTASGTYSPDLIKAFPERDGDYLKVKKILNPDSTS